MDDSRDVHVKRQGPTPPNTYKLIMREEPFHGVRAIRLVPVGDGKMFGRDGLLAHSYMLGPNGQSNGCVSFSDYPAFLDAYLKGEGDRLWSSSTLRPRRAPKRLWDGFQSSLKTFSGGPNANAVEFCCPLLVTGLRRSRRPAPSPKTRHTQNRKYLQTDHG